MINDPTKSAPRVKRRCAEISKSYMRQSGRPCSPFANNREAVKAVLQVRDAVGQKGEGAGEDVFERGNEHHCLC